MGRVLERKRYGSLHYFVCELWGLFFHIQYVLHMRSYKNARGRLKGWNHAFVYR